MINILAYSSPCGELLIAASGDSIVLCDWRSKPRFDRRWLDYGADVDNPVLRQAVAWLDAYFAGNMQPCLLPLKLSDRPLQRLVQTALMSIPAGTVVTYGGLAAAIGRPTAVRAVASALAANPISIFLPCHRIVPAAAARFPGEYRGGADAKKWLICHEKKFVQSPKSTYLCSQ